MKPGTRLGPYELTASIGAGGMGEVFRARDTRLNRDVAVKVLPKDFAADAERLRRFEQEAKTLAALNHPNVMTVFDAGQHEGAPYLVSELLEGKTLHDELRGGALSIRKATDYALQIAQGLAAAHGRGIVHRDLKPDNVFVTKDSRVKILDFGLAKLREVQSPKSEVQGPADPNAPTVVESVADQTEPGRVMGTPSYMAPEQVRGEAVDHRADLFAFGCVLYEMVSGRRPFRRDTSIATMAAILDDEAPDLTAAKPELPPALARIVHRCLEKQPDNRFQSAKDLAFALSELAAMSSASRSPAGESVAARPAAKRFAWPALAAVLAVLLAVLSVAWWRTARTPGRASQIRSLAVLPFAFETQDPKLAGLGKWIPAEIRSKLGPLQNLQVVNSPARIEQLVQQKKSEVEIARELGVDGLVMGELHGQGETMSAYVWVVDGSTGRALGKQREIASSASKVSELPNQVALAIVDELKLQVSASQRTEIQVADTQNSEAFLAFQKGRDLLSSRLFDQAAVELRRAYQLDTNYTRAWTALADSEWIPLIYGGTTNQIATTYRRLANEVERFLAQRPDDPALASLRMWIAMIFERDWNKVRTIFWQSQRNPKPDPGVLQPMSWYYTLIEGHPELALNAGQQSIALAPDNLLYSIHLGHQLSQLGRHDEAVRAFRSLPPEKIQLEDYSRVLLMAGDLVGAKEVATRVRERRPNAMTQCHLAAIHAKSGAGDEARKILRELEAQSEQGLHIPYAQIAWSYGLLGDFESTRRWLRQGLLEGHGDWSMLSLRTADKLEMFGKLAWYWEIVDEMKFPPLLPANPYFALEQAMRYGRGSVGAPTTGTSTNEPPKTLAVLPFVNLSADKQDEYLSDGMTEELLNVLAQVPGLRVPGRSSSFAFKGKTEPNIFRTVGEQLNVSAVLEGSVRKAGNQLRITAQVINVADGFPVWSQTYNRDMTNIFAIQSDIAANVAEALKVQLLGAVAAQKQPTENIEAYQLYLQGRQSWNRRTGESLKQAVEYFTQAIEQDPGYALAYAGLADCHVLIPLYAGTPPREAMPKASAAALKALELDSGLAEPHAALGTAKALFDWDWPGAEAEFRQAIALNPNYATAHHWLAVTVLRGQGRLDESLAALQRAQALDPLSPIINAQLGQALLLAGKTELGIQSLRKQITLDPAFPVARIFLGWGHLHSGRLPEALAELETAHRLGASQLYLSGGLMGFAYGRAGRTGEAKATLVQMLELQRQGFEYRDSIALVQHGLGDDEGALASLEQAVEEKPTLLFYLNFDPLWKDLRPHPRVQAILKRMNLVK